MTATTSCWQQNFEQSQNCKRSYIRLARAPSHSPLGLCPRRNPQLLMCPQQCTMHAAQQQAHTVYVSMPSGVSTTTLRFKCTLAMARKLHPSTAAWLFCVHMLQAITAVHDLESSAANAKQQWAAEHSSLQSQVQQLHAAARETLQQHNAELQELQQQCVSAQAQQQAESNRAAAAEAQVAACRQQLAAQQCRLQQLEDDLASCRRELNGKLKTTDRCGAQAHILQWIRAAVPVGGACAYILSSQPRQRTHRFVVYRLRSQASTHFHLCSYV